VTLAGGSSNCQRGFTSTHDRGNVSLTSVSLMLRSTADIVEVDSVELDASDVEDKVDMVDMVDWPLPREGPRTEEQVNVLLAVKDEFGKNSSFLFLDEGFLRLPRQ